MFQKEKSLKMITSNKSKFLEAQKVLLEMGIVLVQVDTKRFEIQSDELDEIAIFSVGSAAEHFGGPIIAEDAGLFVQHLKGFPGPYSSYVLNTIGLDGILRLMNEIIDRTAHFKSAVAFCESSKTKAEVFTAITEGSIATEKRGTKGFGYDPIFIPSADEFRTFGEMDLEEKNRLSHRAKAIRQFGAWYMHREP